MWSIIFSLYMKKIKYFLIIITVISLIIVITGCSSDEVKTFAPIKRKKSINIFPDNLSSSIISNKPTLIYFYAKWDQTSDEVNPHIEDISKLYKNNINVIKIDVDNPSLAYVVAKFNVGFLPDMVILKRAQTMMRIDGWVDFKTIQSGVEVALINSTY